MNLESFITKIDEIIDGYSTDDLKLAIHKLAIQCRDRDQDKFIKSIQHNDAILESLSEEELSSLQEDENYVEDFIDKIYDQKVELNYDDITQYGRGVKCDQLMFKFYIEEDFLDDLRTACNLLDDYIKLENYRDAYSLARNLLSAKIFASPYRDHRGYEYFAEDFRFLMSKINKTYTYATNLDRFLEYVHKLSIAGLLSAYLLYDGHIRLRKMFDLFKLSPKDILLEDIIRAYGLELPYFQEFLMEWLDFVVIQDRSELVSNLLSDAILLLKDEEEKITRVIDYTDYYPELRYKCYNEIYGNNIKKRIDFAYDSMDRMSINVIVREKVALLAATDLQLTGIYSTTSNVYRDLLLSAFESCPSVKNYFRFLFNFNDGKNRSLITSSLDVLFSKKRKDQEDYADYASWHNNKFEDVPSEFPKDFFNNCYSENGSVIPWLVVQLGEYKIETVEYTKQDRQILSFFDGRFIETLNLATRNKDLLNVTDNYPALSLLILYLFDGKKLGLGCDALLSKVIKMSKSNDDNNFVGFESITSEGKREFFYECFKKWKQLKSIRNTEKTNILGKIDNFLMRHYQALVKNNKRSAYNQCAKYIVAMAEVVESLNQQLSKLDYINKFVSVFPDRTIFKNELRAFCPEFK